VIGPFATSLKSSWEALDLFMDFTISVRKRSDVSSICLIFTLEEKYISLSKFLRKLSSWVKFKNLRSSGCISSTSRSTPDIKSRESVTKDQWCFSLKRKNKITPIVITIKP
jgi:hypothetical protein